MSRLYNPRVLDEETTASSSKPTASSRSSASCAYNVGARYFKTDQCRLGNTPSSAPALQTTTTDYDKILPSFNIASELGHGLVCVPRRRRP
jgi:hypothetical protein